MSDNIDVDLKSAFDVEKVSRDWFRRIPRRRSGDYSLPLTLARDLSIENEFRIGDELLTNFNLGEFVGGSNAESAVRPIPEVFRTKDTDAITQAVVPELPKLMSWLFTKVKPPWQSYTEVSRMGAPFYTPYDDKRWILSKLLPSYLRSDFSILENHVVQIGVRVQPEPLSKVRKFTFIDPNGQVYKADLDRSKAKVSVWGHDRYAGRTRQVFNQPIFNLLGQVVDTALNDVYGQFPCWHHNMAVAGRLVKGPVLAFDVSHMERLTARIVYERAKVIGGAYYAFQHHIRSMPFLVPADDWSCAFKIKCRYDDGWSVQFGSGNSAVAPSQKDIFMILYARFAREQLGIPESVAFDWVAGGGDERLRIYNYGDDNFIFSPVGDTGLLQAVFDYMSQFLTIAKEDPAKFLGYEWDVSDFKSGISSYLLKTYQNERAPVAPFRKYPNFGWVEKRKHYSQYGKAVIPMEVFPMEDRLLRSAGAPFTNVLTAAADERVELANLSKLKQSYFMNANYLLGKQDYLISHEDKVKVGKIGGYTGFDPSDTGPILNNSVGPEWAAVLRNNKNQ